MRGIEGKRVLISGGCGDIGQAVAARFLAGGARVVIADKTPTSDGAALASRLHDQRAHFRQCDVTSPDSVVDAVAFACRKD